MRGSAPVGTTDYTVPGNAIFVSPSGSDTAAGTEAAPLATLGTAIAEATAGATIVLRAGSYNESVSIPESKPNITVMSYPHEAVWLDGTIPVTNWQQTGNTWTSSGWNHFFDNTLDGIADNPYFVNTAQYPLAARADMVFYDGTQLTQVATPSAVTAGTFAVDQTAKTITIGNDPAGHDLRASNLEQAIYAKSTGTTLEGFGVRGYATPYNVRGAIRLGGVGETAQNIVIEDSATTGLNFEADNITLDHLTVTRSGMQGLGGNSTYNTKLTNNVVTYANDEHFNEAPVSGGVKITRSRNLLIENNDFDDNYSFGLWLDESCYDPVIIGNTVTGNAGHGIQLEISAGAIVANNVMTGNGKSGIRLMDTSDSLVINNDIADDGTFGVCLFQDGRREADASVPGHDPRQPIPDPSFSWLVQNDTIANNAFGSGSQFQIYALDSVTNIPVDNWDLTINGNLFNESSTPNQNPIIAWGGADNVTLTRYVDMTAFAQAKGPTWVNPVTPTPTPLTSMTDVITAAAPSAVPLPASVATALGQPTGTRHVGTF